jgi:hypothetical protein
MKNESSNNDTLVFWFFIHVSFSFCSHTSE